MNDSRGRPKINYPEIKRVRSVSVYQPAVPIRSVLVGYDDDDGSVLTWEEIVLGIQVAVIEKYNGPGVHGIIPESAYPVSHSSCDIRDKGFRLDGLSHDGSTDHSVIVWSDDYNCPLPICDSLLEDNDRVVGPATMPVSWWEARIEEKVDEIKRRNEQLRRKRESERAP